MPTLPQNDRHQQTVMDERLERVATIIDKYIGDMRPSREAAAAVLAELTGELDCAGRLRDWVSEFADDPCEYGDGCTQEAMRLRRHGRCRNCSARAAIDESRG